MATRRKPVLRARPAEPVYSIGPIRRPPVVFKPPVQPPYTIGPIRGPIAPMKPRPINPGDPQMGVPILTPALPAPPYSGTPPIKYPVPGGLEQFPAIQFGPAPGQKYISNVPAPSGGTFSAASQPGYWTGAPNSGPSTQTPNQRADIMRELMGGGTSDRPSFGNGNSRSGGDSGSSGGSSGGGGGGYSGGYSSGGGGGYSRPAPAPFDPRARVEQSNQPRMGTDTRGSNANHNFSAHGPRLHGPSEGSTPPPGTDGPITGPGVTDPPVVDPGTGLPVVDPTITAPGYQIAPDPNFAGAALSVPDPVFQQYLASQGGLGAASIGTPYIPTINAPIAATSPFSVASVSGGTPLSAQSVAPAPTYSGTLPPALNSGGLAGNYSEVGSDMFAEQPELLLRDMLNQQYGQGNAGGLYNMLEPYADNLNALYLGQAGQNANAGNKADFTNWLSSQWGNMQRPGTYTNTDMAIKNILNPSASSPLYAYVNEGDPQEQYRNTANLLGSAISMGYHPLFASAMMNRLKQAGLDYQGEAARGGAAMDPFYKYLQTSAGIPSLSQLVGA